MADNGKIDLGGLPLAINGPRDTLVGVNEATGAARRFPMPSTEGVKGYASRVALNSVTGSANQLARVTNDPTPSRNGLYRWDGSTWVQSEDDNSALEQKIAALGGATSNAAGAGSAAPLPPAPAGYRAVVIGGVTYSMPYYNYIAPVDLFIIVGQSNAEGRGDSAQSPAAPNGRYIAGGVINSPLADPVGNALTGSMWPAFANEWFAQTGRLSCYVEAAHGGAALLPDVAGQNWSPSGSLRGSAVTMANDAIAAINASDSLTLGSVYFVWAQGETDAENGVSAAIYQSAIQSLAGYFKVQVPAMSQMLVVRTGARNDLAGAASWTAIRAAQDAACAASPQLRMVYRGTSSFSAAGRALMADALHYNQAGLNLAGKCAALAAATLSADPVVQAAPAILASQAHMDTSAATAGSATNAHTTAVGTRTLVVAVAAVRMTTSNTNIPNNVTFNGVAMAKANALANQSAGDNSAPAQRADVAIFYLTEAQYGAPLGGVTANIVVVSGTATHLISSAAYDLDSEVVQESALGFRIRAATGSLLPVSMTTGAPAALIGAAASAGLSASVLTHTLSGLAETGDGGISDGTHCGQAAFGSAVVGEVAGSPITATLSADVRAAAFLVTAFRKKIAGE